MGSKVRLFFPTIDIAIITVVVVVVVRVCDTGEQLRRYKDTACRKVHRRREALQGHGTNDAATFIPMARTPTTVSTDNKDVTARRRRSSRSSRGGGGAVLESAAVVQPYDEARVATTVICEELSIEVYGGILHDPVRTRAPEEGAPHARERCEMRGDTGDRGREGKRSKW